MCEAVIINKQSGKRSTRNRRLGCKIKLRNTQHTLLFGGIAQLGERLNGIQEVSGSIPLISTKHLVC